MQGVDDGAARAGGGGKLFGSLKGAPPDTGVAAPPATLWTMGSAQGWVLLAAALAGVTAAAHAPGR